ncbi:MAG: type II/IV secretion system protein [Deltaproteobacteria bacterium]|nr:type II/IV secretion system protein [Deltaproteobacteria bacterium]
MNRTSQMIRITRGVAVRSHVPLALLRDRNPSAATLSKAGYASIDDLYTAVAAQFKHPRIELDTVDLSLELVNFVTRDQARKHSIAPVFASAQELSLATSDPTQLQVFDWIGRQHKRAIVLMIATPQEIERAQTRLYEAPTPRLPAEIDVSQAELAAASRVVNTLIANAVEQRASDIHIEVTEKTTVIRFRVDGALREVDSRPVDGHPALVSRIKVLAGMDIAIHHAPQDGRIKLPLAAGDIDLRVSVLPTYWGEKVVCRLLDNRRAAQPLDAIGFDAEQKAQFLDMVRSSYGLVLVTGPTGSGKSTTLYAALNAVRDPESNVVTVEDPVEYQLAGINQVQIAPKRGLTFAGALRSILRQDPDVILVGEVRDQETAQLAAEAALTGHLVLTSVHTNDAVTAVTRMMELGVEPHLIAPSLVGVVAQRLVRTVCAACKELYEPEAAELAQVGLKTVPKGTQIARSKGCPTCHHTGYHGRLAIRELLTIDEPLRAMIAQGAGAQELRATAIASGFRTLRFHALRLWLAGITTTRELIRVTRA